MGLAFPVAGATITQPFGYTGLTSNGPFQWNANGMYYPSGFHTGLDIDTVPIGSIVRNMQYGVVYAASWEGCVGGGCWGYGGGYVVIVKHNGIPFYTSHAHMNYLYVRAGQPVIKGQALGKLDTMGYATGPHDHAAAWFRGLWPTVNGAYPLDPQYFMDGHPGAGDGRVVPSMTRVNPHVNLRGGPGTQNGIVGNTGSGYAYYPYFYMVNGTPPAGFTDPRWKLVWATPPVTSAPRYAWAYAPLTVVSRAVAPETGRHDALSPDLITPYAALVAPGRRRTHTDKTAHAPGGEAEWGQPEPIGQPGATRHRSRAKVWQQLEQHEIVETI